VSNYQSPYSGAELDAVIAAVQAGTTVTTYDAADVDGNGYINIDLSGADVVEITGQITLTGSDRVEPYLSTDLQLRPGTFAFNTADITVAKYTVTAPADGPAAVSNLQVETTSINAQTGTTYTLAMVDRGQTVTMNNASANTITVPTDAAVDFEPGTVIAILQLGAGATTISADTGVTLNGVSAGSSTIIAQYDAVSLLKLGSNNWIITGAAGVVA